MKNNPINWWIEEDNILFPWFGVGIGVVVGSDGNCTLTNSKLLVKLNSIELFSSQCDNNCCRASLNLISFLKSLSFPLSLPLIDVALLRAIRILKASAFIFWVEERSNPAITLEGITASPYKLLHLVKCGRL